MKETQSTVTKTMSGPFTETWDWEMKGDVVNCARRVKVKEERKVKEAGVGERETCRPQV